MIEKLRPDIKKRQTDVVILHVGVNDCRSNDFDLRETIRKYECLINFLESEGVIVIVSLNIFSDSDILNRNIRNLNKELVNMCTRKYVNFISNANISRNNLYDRGGHLNPSGRELLCDNIGTFLNFFVPYVFPN